jgi:acetoin utilization protein AcuB
MTLRVIDYMTKAPFSIAPDETLAAAKNRMEQSGIRHLPVIDGSHLVGVISSRDLFLLHALNERSLQLLKVRDVMTEQPYAVTPQTPISQVATEMANLRIGSAVVRDGTRLVGVFTSVDALRALADSSQDGREHQTTVASAKLRELIAELRRLHAEVQPGEWWTAPNHDHSPRPRCLGIFNGSREVLRHGAMRYSDAALTVAMHNALPQLLDVLEDLEREGAPAQARRDR